MDNPVAWAPKPAGIVLVAAAGVLMALACAAVADDTPGRVLTATAAAGLLVFAAGSARARPKLEISGSELVYRGWVSTRRLRRDDIGSIRITEFRRLGRKTRLLEIDTVDDTLLVLSRWDLGGEPLGVLDALTAAGFTGNGGTR